MRHGGPPTTAIPSGLGTGPSVVVKRSGGDPWEVEADLRQGGGRGGIGQRWVEQQDRGVFVLHNR